MRRPRVRLWMLLVLVALAAGAFGAYRLWRRAQELRATGASYAYMETEFRTNAKRYLHVAENSRGIAESMKREDELIAKLRKEYGDKSALNDPAVIKRYEEDSRGSLGAAKFQTMCADYCARLKHKYDYAARHPWLSVPPDPPRPWSG